MVRSHEDNTSIAHAILDADGVLFEGTTGVNGLFVSIGTACLAELDVDITHEELAAEMEMDPGKSPREVMLGFLKNSPELIQEAIRRHRQLSITDIPRGIKPIDGAAETLGALHEDGVTLSINSAADRDVLDIVIPQIGMDMRWFGDRMFTADNTPGGHNKPEPYAINELVRRTKIPKESTFMVGDSTSDAAAAHYADVEPVVVLTGNLTLEELDRREDLSVRYIIPSVTLLGSVIYQHLTQIERQADIQKKILTATAAQ
ncbi:MAG TPA: HAD hydrolase-like protein [Candidatus Saccharimonadales bacterium]|nr:HAD hydrolase-like protein [Candidatus Saccharimonadales bacterium]